MSSRLGSRCLWLLLLGASKLPQLLCPPGYYQQVHDYFLQGAGWVTEMVTKWTDFSSPASPICQEGQSERTFLILPFLPDFFLISPYFSWFYLLFPPSFPEFWQISPCQRGHSAPFAPVLATPLLSLQNLGEFVGWGHRAIASLTVPGGQEFHFPHFFLKFWSSFLIFPQTLLLFFLIISLRMGESPTREGPGYATGWGNFSSQSPSPYTYTLLVTA